LTPLVIAGSKLKLRDGSTGKETVSWLVHPAHEVVDSRMALTLDGSVTVVTPEYIELDLLVFTSLPIDATPDSFQKATTMIEQHGFMDIHRDLIARADDDVQRTYQSMTAELARLEPDGKGPLSTFHRRFLALTLDRGLDWMLKFADVMQQEFWTGWSYDPEHGAGPPCRRRCAFSPGIL
jgi:hypothetical protein